MKTFYLILITMLLISTGWARPQEFYNTVNPGTPASEVKSQNRDGTLRPIPTGAIYMMSRHGFEAVSPFARRGLGIGQTTLAQPISHDPRPATGTDETRPFGGIRLIGVAF